MNNEIPNTMPMTEEEQAEAMKLFAQALRERPERFSIEHANPIEQYAYTSSSSIIGIFFPNSSITMVDHPAYKVCALSKTVLGYSLILAKNDEHPYSKLFASRPDYLQEQLERIIFNHWELDMRNGLEDTLRDYKKSLDGLKAIGRAYKKDGKPFAKLELNFTNCRMKVETNYYTKPSAVDIWCYEKRNPYGNTYYSQKVHCYLDAEERESDIDAEKVWEIIHRKIETYENLVAKYEKALQHLHRDFMNTEKRVQQFRTFFDTVDETLKSGLMEFAREEVR